jgi:hypothetical protein
MNIEELKNRLQQLNRRTDKPKDIWKPRDEHDVRLIRYPHGDESLIELYFHYEIGDQSVLCPKANFGKDCEICDFCDLLKSWKTPQGNDKAEKDRKSDWELFKKIQPKARVFVPMVERGKESEGARWWGVTPNQSLEILKVCVDGDRMAECGVGKDEKDANKLLSVLVSETKAYDLHVSFAKPGEKGNTKTFAQTVITGKIKAGPLMPDKKSVKELVASVKNIRDVYPEVSSEEVGKILKKFAGSVGPEAKPEGGTEKYPANTNENAKTVGKRTIDEAFGDLLNEGKKE